MELFGEGGDRPERFPYRAEGRLLGDMKCRSAMYHIHRLFCARELQEPTDQDLLRHGRSGWGLSVRELICGGSRLRLSRWSGRRKRGEQSVL